MFSRDVKCEICGYLIPQFCVVAEGPPYYEELCSGCRKAVKDAKEQQLKLAKQCE